MLESSLKATMVAMNILAYQMELRIREDEKQKEAEGLRSRIQELEQKPEQAQKENRNLEAREKENEQEIEKGQEGT